MCLTSELKWTLFMGHCFYLSDHLTDRPQLFKVRNLADFYDKFKKYELVNSRNITDRIYPNNKI